MTTQTVSPNQLVVLKALDFAFTNYRNDGAISTMTVQIAICRNFQKMSQASVTRSLNTLFSKGLVEKCGTSKNRQWFFGILSNHTEVIAAAEAKAAKKAEKSVRAKQDSITAVRAYFAK